MAITKERIKQLMSREPRKPGSPMPPLISEGEWQGALSLALANLETQEWLEKALARAESGLRVSGVTRGAIAKLQGGTR
jgi:hypothetical protein